MQMKNNLPAAPLNVEKQFVSRIRYAYITGRFFAPQDEFRYNCRFFFRNLVDTSDMLFRYDEKMNRSMGMDIFEHHQHVVLVQKFSRLFSLNDLTKNTILFHYFLKRRRCRPPASSASGGVKVKAMGVCTARS
jgi:hypothetical protein